MPFGKANKNLLFSTFSFSSKFSGIENKICGFKISESTERFVLMPIVQKIIFI